MGSESIVHEAEGRMEYWLRGHEGDRNNCFSKFQLVGQKTITVCSYLGKTKLGQVCTRTEFISLRNSLLNN